MAQNLATKYSKKVDERFALQSLTESAMNKDYEWDGVDTVKIYGVDTVENGDYKRSGLNRYGNADDLGTSVQTMKLTKDRAFTYIIDKGNHIQSEMVTESGKALARQVREREVPEIDIYRLEKMALTAKSTGAFDTTAITKGNAYEMFLKGTEWMGDHKILNNYVAFITPKFFNLIRLDNSFIKGSDMGQKILLSGQVGEVDGVALIKVPSSYMPGKVPFIFIHKSVMVSPKQLKEHKTHINPPGISGWLTEGRFIYDAFVREQKKDGIYAHIEGVGDLSVETASGSASGKKKVTSVKGATGNGHALYYKVVTTEGATLPAFGEVADGYTELVLDTDIAVSTTQSICVVEVNNTTDKNILRAKLA